MNLDWWWPMLAGLASSGELRRIAFEADSTPEIVYLTWGQLCDHAWQQPDRSSIDNIDEAVIATRCDVPVSEIWRILATFTRWQMLGGGIAEIQYNGETFKIGRRIAWPRLARLAGRQKSRNRSQHRSAPVAAKEDGEDRADEVRRLAKERKRRQREREKAGGVTAGVTRNAPVTRDMSRVTSNPPPRANGAAKS
jgi:hypothetical protein